MISGGDNAIVSPVARTRKPALKHSRNTSTIASVGGTFGDMTLTYTTGAVAPTGNIRLFVKEVDTATRIHVDNFRLDATPIPEPSVLAGFMLGGGLLIRRRRR